MYVQSLLAQIAALTAANAALTATNASLTSQLATANLNQSMSWAFLTINPHDSVNNTWNKYNLNYYNSGGTWPWIYNNYNFTNIASPGPYLAMQKKTNFTQAFGTLYVAGKEQVIVYGRVSPTPVQAGRIKIVFPTSNVQACAYKVTITVCNSALTAAGGFAAPNSSSMTRIPGANWNKSTTGIGMYQVPWTQYLSDGTTLSGKAMSIGGDPDSYGTTGDYSGNTPASYSSVALVAYITIPQGETDGWVESPIIPDPWAYATPTTVGEVIMTTDVQRVPFNSFLTV